MNDAIGAIDLSSLRKLRVHAGAVPGVWHVSLPRAAPLSNAVFNDAQEITQLLLAAGADPSLKNNHDVSPAELAESMGMKLPRPKRRPAPKR